MHRHATAPSAGVSARRFRNSPNSVHGLTITSFTYHSSLLRGTDLRRFIAANRASRPEPGGQTGWYRRGRPGAGHRCQYRQPEWASGGSPAHAKASLGLEKNHRRTMNRLTSATVLLRFPWTRGCAILEVFREEIGDGQQIDLAPGEAHRAGVAVIEQRGAGGADRSSCRDRGAKLVTLARGVSQRRQAGVAQARIRQAGGHEGKFVTR